MSETYAVCIRWSAPGCGTSDYVHSIYEDYEWAHHMSLVLAENERRKNPVARVYSYIEIRPN